MFRKIASGLFGEPQALPCQFCAHFTDTVENPGWFGVALFQVIKCRLAGEDTDRIDSCIDTAGDVCVDAVTDDHGVLFGDAELFKTQSIMIGSGLPMKNGVLPVAFLSMMLMEPQSGM